MKKQIFKATMLIALVFLGMLVALKVFAADNAVTIDLTINQEDGWLMWLLNDGWLKKYYYNHTLLLYFLTAAGPWSLYGILKTLAKISNKVEGSDIFKWLGTFWFWRVKNGK